MKRTVALKRNCCSLPDSKAQSNPGAMGTSESHPSSNRPPSWSPVRMPGSRDSSATSRVQRGCRETSPPAGTARCSHSEGQLWEGDCLILTRPNTQEKQAAGCGRVEPALAHGPGRLTPRTRWAAPAAPATCYWGRPVGWRAGITDRCWKGILTVHFLVQVKSFFQLILLFVPSGLPLLPSLHTSNGFSLDPAKNKRTLTTRERTVSFTPASGLTVTAFTAISLEKQSTHHQNFMNKSTFEHKQPSPFVKRA